jgi:hypothetical protein
MRARSALEDAGVKIPEDVSIVGIDDISFAFLARPPLTTISVPRERLGVTAFQALDKVRKLKRHMGADYRLETGTYYSQIDGSCTTTKSAAFEIARVLATHVLLVVSTHSHVYEKHVVSASTKKQEDSSSTPVESCHPPSRSSP